MGMASVRATIYVEASLHQALRLRAAKTNRTISELVNDAIRDALNNAGDGRALGDADYDVLLARLRGDLRPSGSCAWSAEQLLDRWKRLPLVDPVQLRADIDNVIDSSL
jgi:hypothetical protein